MIEPADTGDTLRPGSFRWWFENRETGEITVAQAPNWPLYALGAVWLIRRFTDTGTRPDDALGATWVALWLFWGADEALRGVNPWRRVLGLSVVAWQAWRLLG